MIVVLLSLSLSAWAKAVIYDMHHGLSSNTIRTIAKDQRGLMWVGTHNGLNIFDGNEFSKMKGALSSLTIYDLKYDTLKDALWALTNQGLYLINTHTITAEKIDFAGRQQEDQNALTFASMCLDHSGAYQLIVTYKQGLVAAVNKHKELVPIARKPATQSIQDGILALRDSGYLIWDENIHLLNRRRISRLRLDTSGQGGKIFTFALAGDTLWAIGANGTLSQRHYQHLGQTGARHHKLFPGKEEKYEVKNAALVRGILYVSANDYSFYKYNLQTERIEDISAKYRDEFEGRECYHIFVDERNIIWLATNKGLIKIDDRPALFDRILHNMPNRVSTRQIVEDVQGDLYVGSYVGLLRHDRATNSWERQPLQPELGKEMLVPYSIINDVADQYLYIGENSPHLFRYYKKTRTFEQVAWKVVDNGGKISDIYILERDARGVLWLGSSNGLATYNPVNNTVTIQKKTKFDIGPSLVRFIHPSKTHANQLIVGTSSGLFILDIDHGIVARITNEGQPTLSNNDVLCLHQDDKGYLWLGTNGGGINIIDPELKEIRYIRGREGLSNEIVYSMVAQDEKTLWVGTYSGLGRYRKDINTFTNFFEEDGLASNEFNHNSSLRLKDGRILFGSINGISAFYPKDLGPPEAFRLFISGLSKWNDQERSVILDRSDINNRQTVIKRPNDLLLELHLGCTDYSNPLGNTFSYRIPAFSDEWVSLENKHTINLGGMPYGNYRLEIAALNAQGSPAANIIELNIKILQPFYKTWWFYLLLVLGVSAVLYTIYRFQYHNLKAEHRLRVRIASNLHDDVGSLLTRITMFSENLRYGNNSESQRNQKLEKIALLSRDATNSMSDVLWSIDSRNNFAGNLLDRMREHAEDMLLPLQIDINFVVADTDMRQYINTHDRRDLYLIFKEAIHNIAKHSKATQVNINFSIQSNNFHIKIENNGALNNQPGTPQQHTGQGLENMRMRAAKIKAVIQMTQEGDTFSITISKNRPKTFKHPKLTLS